MRFPVNTIQAAVAEAGRIKLRPRGLSSRMDFDYFFLLMMSVIWLPLSFQDIFENWLMM